MNNQYAEEARRRFGETDAYRESEQRTANYIEQDWSALSDGMDAVIGGFAKLNTSGVTPDDEEAHLHVRKLQQFISNRLYTCTDEILRGLGQMYVADKRFQTNIDKHGEGTAAYIAACIESCCA